MSAPRMLHCVMCTAPTGHPTDGLQALSHKYRSQCSTPGCALVRPHGFDTLTGFITDHDKNKRLTTAEMVTAANGKKTPAHNLRGMSLFKAKN